ncbi:hypothetical protein CFB48_19470 [Burkholderia sp. AU33647]|nr:hypothetical protein CFB48_19470 [Burkholderia sp. AU33647]
MEQGYGDTGGGHAHPPGRIGPSLYTRRSIDSRETLINGPTSEVAGEMASNFLDDEANRRSIQ